MRAASLSLGFGVGLIALGCAGGNSAVMAGGYTGEDPDASALAPDGKMSDAGPDGAAGAPDTDSAATDDSGPVLVDPAVSHALLAKTGEAGGNAPLGLRFEIVELGAELPWAFAIVNRGTETVSVDFDARLLSLEVLPPADQKPQKNKAAAKPAKPLVCRLPGDVAPHSVDAALATKLEPGEGLVQNFDPRLYCMGKTSPLIQGATVTPHFGFAPKMKVTWKNGRHEEVAPKQVEPFVAEPSDTPGSLPEKSSAEVTERRVKELAGTPLTLGSDFADPAASSAAPAHVPTAAEIEADPLVLTLAGGDATDEGTATATTTIANRDKKSHDVYFRRELVSYEISGPDGLVHCDPQPDLRSPDRLAFQTLRPGGKFSAVSRLIEMCPAHTFSRPGLYLVHGRFDPNDPGTDFGLHAYTGRVVSRKPALLRIHRGPLPFTPAGGAVRVRVGQ